MISSAKAAPNTARRKATSQLGNARFLPPSSSPGHVASGGEHRPNARTSPCGPWALRHRQVGPCTHDKRLSQDAAASAGLSQPRLPPGTVCTRQIPVANARAEKGVWEQSRRSGQTRMGTGQCGQPGRKVGTTIRKRRMSNTSRLPGKRLPTADPLAEPVVSMAANISPTSSCVTPVDFKPVAVPRQTHAPPSSCLQ